jgi:hypothetical protein
MLLRPSRLAALFALLPAIAVAQRTTTGTVAGKVVDSSGAVLPGVTVTLKSAEALGAFTAVTDGTGTYRVANLPPALYEARAELQGFQTVTRQVTVRLNAVLDVDFTLSVGSMAETVVVTGEAPIVDPERAGLSINISNKALTSVPLTTDRKFQDVWLMVPDSGGAGQGGERRTSIDGMDVTDPFNGDFNAVNLNADAIQDVEVKALGAEASDGASMVGQFLNVVTKSGGNDVHGSAAFALIAQSFNSSNVAGVPPNRRRNIQPDLTLGGPIVRDRIWFFTSYRRIQQDITQNNAPVPAEQRGDLWFVKGTSQLRQNHRLQATFQWDRTVQRNGVIRTSATSQTFGSASTGLNSGTAQLAQPEAFGTLLKGGPLAGFNYNWVAGSRVVVQAVGSFMINKPNTFQPNDGDPLVPTKVIQTNAAGNIAGSLTTISQEGGFGGVSKSERSMIYLAPSATFVVDKVGSHEFRGGADLYPSIRNKTSLDAMPVELYFRPPGTTGASDVLFERDVLRNLDGTGGHIDNLAYEHHYAAYFQDRWKPSSRVSIKAGVRVETLSIFTKDRSKVLPQLLPPSLPTNTSDLEFHQTTGAPNFGIAINAGKWGVLRGTMGRQYEWLDLGGNDGTSHAPYVLATDVFRSNPRTVAPVLNQTLPGSLAVSPNFGDSKDGTIHNGRTHLNEFSGGWEHKLPNTSSLSAVFLWRRNWDVQSSVDINVIRDPITGKFLGRVYPDFNTINQTYNQQFQWFQNRSLQFLYTKNFTSAWGINATYWYVITSTVRTRFNPTVDTLQFLGFTPDDVLSQRATGRHRARVSAFARLPLGITGSVFYSYNQGNRSNVMTGDFPLNAAAPTVILSNGRAVSDPFFNPAYPRARKNDVDMITLDDTHIVNIRVEKSFELPGGRRFSVSGDAFNLFNAAAVASFLSADIRSANFGLPSTYQAPRVAQLAVRMAF